MVGLEPATLLSALATQPPVTLDEQGFLATRWFW